MKVDIKFDPKGKKHSIQALCNGLCQIIASLYQKFVSVTFFETFHIICVCVLVAQSCPTLCDPMDCSPPGSSVHRIFQTRILEWVAISFSRRSSQPRDQTQVSYIAGGFFANWATKEAQTVYTLFQVVPAQHCTVCLMHSLFNLSLSSFFF